MAFTEESRDYDFIPGSGSYVEVFRYENSGVLEVVPIIFDVAVGFLRETFRNENTTHSGSNGADLYTRVGAGWNFSLALKFPARLSAGEDVVLPFPEMILGSLRSVALRFYVGRPAYWQAMDQAVRSFYGAKALLDTVEMTFDATGTKTVGLNIAGTGSSILFTQLDGVNQSPQLWF